MKLAAERAQYESAKGLLDAIRTGDPEYKEAQHLLLAVNAKLKKFKEEDEINAEPLKVVKSDWSKGGFGTVALWRVTFHNRSGKPVGNIRYRTAYYAETGAQVDKGGVDSILSKGLIQRVIGPRQKRTIEINDGFVNQEAVRGSFSVVSWEYIQ